jgi:Transposase DDE domain group 1
MRLLEQQKARRSTFQVKQKYHKIIAKNRRSIERRLKRKNYKDQAEPMLKAVNLEYQVGERTRAIGYGGIGAMHTMVCKLGLDQAINEQVKLLEAHLPYHESDHVLNLTYNVLSGGTCLEDIERLRQDESYLNGLGAERIPDPTTAGDFLRRFGEADVLALQEAINGVRQRVWKRQGAAFLAAGIIDVDGTIAGTSGACKGGMDMSYKGIWGYAPLLLTLAPTKEVLYLVNRPGNKTSADGAPGWIDRSIKLVGGTFAKVWVRGDTDFSLTKHLDRWNEQASFVFGYDTKANLVTLAEELPAKAWKRLHRPARYEVQTVARERPENVKEQVVKAREYRNLRLLSEDVAEFNYRPGACQQDYRMVVVRKNLSVEKGEAVLFDDIRYFFYITNDWEQTREEIVFFANDRCNQENIIGQLKSGVGALRMPSSDLLSNWAYMVIASLAWNLKSWYGLLTPDQAQGAAIVRMEFKRFLLSLVQLPCQIVKSGRRVVYRILAYRADLKLFLKTFDYLRKLRLT